MSMRRCRAAVFEETARTEPQIEHRRFDTLRCYLHSRAKMND